MAIRSNTSLSAIHTQTQTEYEAFKTQEKKPQRITPTYKANMGLINFPNCREKIPEHNTNSLVVASSVFAPKFCSCLLLHEAAIVKVSQHYPCFW